MVLSMTAFGRIKKKIGSRTFIVEVHSVNRKSLEIGLNLPLELSFAEIPIRKKVAERCHRGHVIIKFIPESSDAERITEGGCRTIYDSLKRVAKSLDKNFDVTFDQVINIFLKFGNTIAIDEKKIEKEVLDAVDEAIDQWLIMKKEEGAALIKDIDDRIVLVEKALKKIEKEGSSGPEKYRLKIENRLKEMCEVGVEEQSRIAREVVIFSEKADITEEIIRMKSHISQARKLMKDRKMGSIGREMQFLVQEMMREMNTISAKSTEVLGVNEAIFARSEIEKIKEQVQNVE